MSEYWEIGENRVSNRVGLWYNLQLSVGNSDPYDSEFQTELVCGIICNEPNLAYFMGVWLWFRGINFSTLKKNAKNSEFVEKFSYNTNANYTTD